VDPQEEIVRLLAIQVRRSSANQGETILDLSRAGFGPKRISELLGTSSNTVNVALTKDRALRRKGS